MSENRGLVFDIQRYSVHDGPGIRTLVFLKGCPLRCLWCSNPEGQEGKPELSFRPTLCIGCGVCIEVCPLRAIRSRERLVEIDRKSCNLCGECIRACSPEALSMVGRRVTVGEVLEEVERDLVFYETSQGGITLSGGEPFAQASFTEALLKACKARGLATAIETSGCAPWESIERVLPYADLLLYDIKHPNPWRHRERTGVSNDLILENAGRMAALGVPLAMRCAVIPGFNDDPQDMDELFDFVAALPGARQIDLLPYHRLGESKYGMLGRDYLLREVKPLARQSLEGLVQAARRRGLEARIVM